MNREIKFRGKRKDKINNEWYYGFLIVEPNNTYWIDNFVNGKRRTVEVTKESTGQYAGIKNNDGVEIYEGDIVHYDGKLFHIYALKVTGLIVNHKGSWALKYKQNWKTDCGREVFSYYNFSCEDFFHVKSNVIGNIHENIELLNY